MVGRWFWRIFARGFGRMMLASDCVGSSLRGIGRRAGLVGGLGKEFGDWSCVLVSCFSVFRRSKQWAVYSGERLNFVCKTPCLVRRLLCLGPNSYRMADGNLAVESPWTAAVSAYFRATKFRYGARN
jgi:hypothetical protein